MAQGAMQTAASSAGAKATSWTKRDTEWMLTLFGTAIGAGVLFLPINGWSGRHLAPDFDDRSDRSYDFPGSPWPDPFLSVFQEG